MAALTPARILEVGMGFFPTKTLLSAVELSLFTTVGASAMTGEALPAARAGGAGLLRHASCTAFSGA